MQTYSIPRLIDLAVSERPQERLERLGAEALSDRELLAMILRSGSQETDVLALATQLMAQAGSLASLLTWVETDYRSIKGIGKVKALQLVALVEIARRIHRQAPASSPLLETPLAVAELLGADARSLQVEKFWILCLNRKNRLMRRVEVTSGTGQASLVHPGESFREAIRYGASAVIAAHNHPSGDPSPSKQDIQVTRQLREAGSVVNIPLLDHVIVGQAHCDPQAQGYYSFSEAGLI